LTDLSSLAPGELEALREVAKPNPLKRTISVADREKLLSLGLIASKPRGYAATDKALDALLRAGYEF
jgi:hypothetical protein